jgi:two-component sensor histidine kinase
MTLPSWFRPVARGLFLPGPRPLVADFGITLAALLAGVAARLLVDPFVAGHLPYLTFYPSLVAVAILCRLPVTIGFVIASAALGSLLWDPAGNNDPYFWAVGSILFISTAAVIVALTEGIKDAYRQIADAEGRLQTVNGELIHRIRNLFQISAAIVSQSVRAAASPEDLEHAVLGRLSALSAAQTIALAGTGYAPIASVAEVTLKPLAPGSGRLRMSGPSATLPAQTMTMLALVLYELGTNAVKYGAWSGSDGTVEVRWRTAGGMLAMDWTERGGPPVEKPGRAGAGSKLIRGAISGASVDYRLERDGVKCRIELALGGTPPGEVEHSPAGQSKQGESLASKFQALLRMTNRLAG